MLTKGADAKLKLTYWDFLGAVAVAPAFCTTKGSGQLAGLGAAAVCARELAALWALGAANSNGLEAEAGKAATPKQGTTWAEQGWKKATDARCALAKADLEKQPAHVQGACTAGGAPTSATSAEAKAAGTGAYHTGQGGLCAGGCKAGETYPPRGPALLSGVGDTYWFAKLAQGKADPAKDAGSALKDPTLLESGPDYWLSGIYKWMVPAGGRPAPHNIITGWWAPGPGQEQVPAGDGWGALVQLARPEACGKQSRGQLARVLDDSWRAMQQHF